MAFPVSPANGQTYTLNGKTYVYVSASGTWKVTTAADTSPTLITTAGGQTISDGLTTTGTLTGGNLATGGNASVAGNASVTGNLTVTANANVGNLGTAGLITATGNVSGGNLTTGGNANITGTANAGNVATSGTLNVTGNANVGNIGTTAVVATGNISGTNVAVSGNLTFSDTGNRITGDMSNATIANRVLFQTSTANASTIISAVPNGTGIAGQFAAYNNSDSANASTLVMSALAAEARIATSRAGTGTYLPMTFLTSGSERMRVDINGNLGIGDTNPTVRLSVGGTDAIKLPVGNTSQRPGAVSGYVRFNSDTATFEGHNGTNWGALSGATGNGTDQIFYLNGQTVNSSFSIPTNNNAGSFGPITIDSGITVTIPSGSSWSIV